MYNRGANNLYGSLQKRLGKRIACNLVLRLVPNREALENLRIDCSCRAANDPFLTVDDIFQWPAIVTTFITAIQLREMEIRDGKHIPFTHILIDEGAQSPEPETLGALMLAKEQTRVAIVGDNQQASIEYHFIVFSHAHCMCINQGDINGVDNGGYITHRWVQR